MHMDIFPQYHFVVCYDAETEKWIIDWDTTGNSLQEGQVWTRSGDWETPEENDERYGNDYAVKAKDLEDHLKMLQSKAMIIAPSLGAVAGEEDEDED